MKTVFMMPKEGSAFPDRTCCCVFTTSNGFTRKDASAPAVAPQMKLLAGRGRSVFFTTERVCSRLRFICPARASHQPVEGGEGDVAQEVRVDALPEVQHAVDAGFAAHALDRSDQTAGPCYDEETGKCLPGLGLGLQKLQRLHADNGEGAGEAAADGRHHPRNPTHGRDSARLPVVVK